MCIRDRPVGILLQVLDLFPEVLVAVDVDLVKLVLIDEVLGDVFQILVRRSVEFSRICEENSALFEGKSADLCQLVSPFNGFDGPIKKLINDELRLQPGLLPLFIFLHTRPFCRHPQTHQF